MDRRTALGLLGLDGQVDLVELKARFRELARIHHPDRGGDAATFRRLQGAYALLQAELAAPTRTPRPRVARGRPSRSAVPHAHGRTPTDVALTARAEELAVRLAAGGRCTVVSRAPGSRLNRLAAALTVAATGRLELRFVPQEGGGPPALRITLDGRGRRVRRALGALDPTTVAGTSWTRQRGDARTVLTATLAVPATDASARTGAARRGVATTSALLNALAWPLDAWVDA